VQQQHSGRACDTPAGFGCRLKVSGLGAHGKRWHSQCSSLPEQPTQQPHTCSQQCIQANDAWLGRIDEPPVQQQLRPDAPADG
jgi:hypothetical protein